MGVATCLKQGKYIFLAIKTKHRNQSIRSGKFILLTFVKGRYASIDIKQVAAIIERIPIIGYLSNRDPKKMRIINRLLK